MREKSSAIYITNEIYVLLHRNTLKCSTTLVILKGEGRKEGREKTKS